MIDKKRLYIFDMDGTLLPGTFANKEIAKVMGKLPAIRAIEVDFAKGLIDQIGYSKKLYKILGVLPKASLDLAFKNAHKLKNIKEVIAKIKSEGHVCCLMTLSGDVFAENFQDYGFDYIFSAKYPRYEGEEFLSQMMSPEKKLILAKELCQQHGLSLRDCIAFGDSYSDYPLFENLYYTVSVNGDEKIRSISLLSYQGDDLLSAYEKIQQKLPPQKASYLPISV